MLMKLKLDVLLEDLSDRFGISATQCGRVYNCWLTATEKGKAQIDPADARKTAQIANLRILVEQLIRQLKCFRILAHEMVIDQLQFTDDLLKVCAALSNL